MKQTKEQLEIALRERQGKIEHLELEISNLYVQKETEYLRGYKDSTALTWLLMKKMDSITGKLFYIFEQKQKMIQEGMNPKYLYMNPISLHKFLLQNKSNIIVHNLDHLDHLRLFDLIIKVDNTIKDDEFIITQEEVKEWL